MPTVEPNHDSRRSFEARLRAMELPLDQIIVIGGGALALHGLREAGDIDLIVTRQLFDKVENDTSWKLGKQGSPSHALVKGEAEIWPDWSVDGSGHPNYEDLMVVSEVINGIRVVSLDYLVVRKRERGLAKDLEDINLIERYQGIRL